MIAQTPEIKLRDLRYFKIQLKNDEYSKNWRNALVQIVTKNRAVDNQLREQIAKRLLYICELCYRENQINRCKIEKYFSSLVMIVIILFIIKKDVQKRSCTS